MKLIKKTIAGLIILLVIVLIIFQSMKKDITISFIKNYKDKVAVIKLVSPSDQKVISETEYLIYVDPELKKFLASYESGDELEVKKSVLSNTVETSKVLNKTKNLSYNFALEKRQGWFINLNLSYNKKIVDLKATISGLELDVAKTDDDRKELIELYRELSSLTKEDVNEKIEIIEKEIELSNKKENIMEGLIVKPTLVGNTVIFEIINLSKYSIGEIFGKVTIQDEKGAIIVSKDLILYKRDPNFLIFSEYILPNYKKQVGLKFKEKISNKDKISFEVTSFKE